jgi:hypothetical protein
MIMKNVIRRVSVEKIRAGTTASGSVSQLMDGSPAATRPALMTHRRNCRFRLFRSLDPDLEFKTRGYVTENW